MTNYQSLPAETRVWIYQANRPLTSEEIARIQQPLQQFTNDWVSHSRDLQAHGQLLHQQFLVLMVDETKAGASGCSIDSSVRFVKQLQGVLGVDFFDRMLFTYQEGTKIKTMTRDEMESLYQEGKISDATLVFDNLIKTKAQLESAWLKPLGESWHKRLI